MTDKDLIGSAGHVGFVTDIQHDRLGLAAGTIDFRNHLLQALLAASRHHYRPAICSQRFGAGLADPAAAARDPRHLLPAIFHANYLPAL
jgi:hypothetical protein